MYFKNSAGNVCQLNPTPIGSGGEGDIYPVRGTSSQVAKIYKAGAMTGDLEEKLRVMVANPPNSEVLTQVAWPLDVLYDDSGQCKGFVMPKLNITHELGEIYKYPSMLPLSSYQKVNIAQNICVVISEVHKAGYVFGDFNPRNIGLDINTGLVSFLDTDTYHVHDKSKGVTHRCNVCAPGYAAPELLERCSDFVAAYPAESKHAYAKTPLPTFTQETDNFALAIHIFKLLMNGYTPFGGIIETAAVSQSSPGVGDAAVKRDSYCFKLGLKHQSVAILPLEAFPPDVADLFTRAFILGKIDPRQRPFAEEWHGALSRFGLNMKLCRNDSFHYYYKENRVCPLCEADERFAEATGLYTTYADPLLTQNTSTRRSSKSSSTSAQTSMSQATGQRSSVSQPSKSNRLLRLAASILAAAAIFIGIVYFTNHMYITDLRVYVVNAEYDSELSAYVLNVGDILRVNYFANPQPHFLDDVNWQLVDFSDGLENHYVTLLNEHSTGFDIVANRPGSFSIFFDSHNYQKSFVFLVKSPARNILLNDEANNLRLRMGANTWIHNLASLYPPDTTDAMSFSSSNPAVASVDLGGNINARQTGTAAILISAGDVSTYVWLEVYIPVDAIVMDTDRIVLELGEEYRIFASVLPFNATNQQIEFSLHRTWGSLFTADIWVGSNGHITVLQGYDRFLSGQVFEGYVQLRADDVLVYIPLTIQNSFAWNWSDRQFTVDGWTGTKLAFENPIIGCTGFDISVWSVRYYGQGNPLPHSAWGRNWRFFVHSNNRWGRVAYIRIDQHGVWTETTTIPISARDVTMIALLPPSGIYGQFTFDINITAIHRD